MLVEWGCSFGKPRAYMDMTVEELQDFFALKVAQNKPSQQNKPSPRVATILGDTEAFR